MEKDVEDVKVEETGVETQTTEKNEGYDLKSEAQKMADAIVAKKLAKMPTKEQLQEYNEYLESKKSEQEKQAEMITELSKKDKTIQELKNENTLLKKGISAEDSDYVLFKVSKMEGEFADNLEIFLKDNPKYQTKEETKIGAEQPASTLPKGGAMDYLDKKYANNPYYKK